MSDMNMNNYVLNPSNPFICKIDEMLAYSLIDASINM